ncbi:hypothetical protein Psesu_1351 [Pseudoxanthomonas suwonensis 11-1]|uniref:DUF3348 domain-containing protein n=1 Tax=Pseudoxanthomonas suwonensis (strain 11-1) TaxID=743721 RepID=E6WSI4_PSEUU|nr:DUF3348 domain-containing protein [Pseudoxanthomonas suwonensis]ADV27198.1 hypothetical protein Psesu_1351 [Pseudoxanthomonas suwonensis 11-1]
MQSPSRTTPSGPRFVRQLAQLAGTGVDAPSHPLSQLLSHWLEWKQAVALARVLDAPAGDATGTVAGETGDAAAELAQARASLAQSIARDRAFAAPPDGPRPPFEWTYFQQRHMALQHLLESGTGRLRESLRQHLAARSPALARLAAVDAVMEQSLARPTRSLLARATPVLEHRFRELSPENQEASASAAAPAWLDSFRHDMRELLLAELDIRLQPAEGLLAALGPAPTGPHATNPS